MTSKQLRKLGQESAKLYYKFLEDNDRGTVNIAVKRIKVIGQKVILFLAKNVVYIEAIEFVIRKQKFNISQIIPIEYDSDLKIMSILPKPQLMRLFDDLLPEEIAVISDLKYLVKRVEDWYKFNGEKINIPSKAPNIEMVDSVNYQIMPSADQITAIQGALTYPLTYIWGAPGTGKTRMVLANSIVGYVEKNRKILLLAPTNNSVEQMLYGVLDVFEKMGILINNILRLGLPSKEFAINYPEVCEHSGIEKRIQQNTEQVKILEKCCKYREFSKKLSVLKQELPEFFELIENEEKRKIKLNQQLQKTQLEIERNKVEQIKYKREIDYLNNKIRSIKLKMDSVSFKIFGALSPQSIKIQREMLDADLESLNLLIKKNESLISSNIILQEQFNYDRKLLYDDSRIINAIKKIKKLSEFYRPLFAKLIDLKKNNYKELQQEVSDCIIDLDSNLYEREEIYEKYSSMSEEQIKLKICNLNNEVELLHNQTTQARAKEVCVIAATVDAFISRLSDGKKDNENFEKLQYKPEHIFMDEAGYCPLIKGLTLLAESVPVTFLGDHMQLPPVCEMNDDQISLNHNSSIFMWAQSSIFVDDVFNKSENEMWNSYLNGECVGFSTIKKFDLIHSYRFGDNLANILAKSVYTSSFKGNLDAGTEIIFLNAHKNRGEKGRTNIAEAEEIKAFIENNEIKDYAIITPYKNQVSLFGERIKAAQKNDRIMTVHASQGREWETVFFSVVDTQDKWFTNSQNRKSKGKEVVNTALSRACKRLIIACDVDYWLTQPKQLICELIKSADGKID